MASPEANFAERPDGSLERLLDPGGKMKIKLSAVECFFDRDRGALVDERCAVRCAIGCDNRSVSPY
jgi:hypothetical protein